MLSDSIHQEIKKVILIYEGMEEPNLIYPQVINI